MRQNYTRGQNIMRIYVVMYIIRVEIVTPTLVNVKFLFSYSIKL